MVVLRSNVHKVNSEKVEQQGNLGTQEDNLGIS